MRLLEVVDSRTGTGHPCASRSSPVCSRWRTGRLEHCQVHGMSRDRGSGNVCSFGVC